MARLLNAVCFDAGNTIRTYVDADRPKQSKIRGNVLLQIELVTAEKPLAIVDRYYGCQLVFRRGAGDH